MTIDEAIARYKNNAEYERTHGNLQGCLEFIQLAEWLKELKRLKEKDEPREVRYECDGYTGDAMVYDTAFCPNCNHEFGDYNDTWESEFCPNCGQRLRWEE